MQPNSPPKREESESYRILPAEDEDQTTKRPQPNPVEREPGTPEVDPPLWIDDEE